MNAPTGLEDPAADAESGNAKLPPKPDVSSDRVLPAKDAESRGGAAKSPPLKIQQIEDLEDDAKGG